MVKRIAAFIGVVGLSIPLFGGVASALPNFALTADPQLLDFGRVKPALGTVSALVTITNVSADNLDGGLLRLPGDVNLPAGFSVAPRPGARPSPRPRSSTPSQ